jgi:LmeA-like phospholipid-binding
MRKLLLALAAGVVLFVAADRISVAVAENQISSRIAASYGLSAKPAVAIAGFPFLTQVAAGSYRAVDVSAGQVEAGGTLLHNLQARFTGVHASVGQVLGGGAATVTADRATGTAVVTYSEVDKRLPGGLRLRPDGKHLVVSGTVRYGGTRIPVDATVDLGVSGAGIQVTPVHVTISGGSSLPAAASAARLGIVVPVTALPLHLRLTSVHAASGGLRISAAARHVHFARA